MEYKIFKKLFKILAKNDKIININLQKKHINLDLKISLCNFVGINN